MHVRGVYFQGVLARWQSGKRQEPLDGYLLSRLLQVVGSFLELHALHRIIAALDRELEIRARLMRGVIGFQIIDLHVNAEFVGGREIALQPWANLGGTEDE